MRTCFLKSRKGTVVFTPMIFTILLVIIFSIIVLILHLR